jgi:hypothetical protein
VEKEWIELDFNWLHVWVLDDLLSRIPDRLKARKTEPKSVINIGPWESNAWIIPRTTELNKVPTRANNNGKIEILGLEPQVQLELEQESEQAFEQESEHA